MQIAVDDEGFLKDLDDWSQVVATELACEDGIDLTCEHWEIIYFLRDFHTRYGLIPAMRVLVSQLRKALGPEKGRSIHLLRLFPDSPVKRAARIAGLPKPTNCD